MDRILYRYAKGRSASMRDLSHGAMGPGNTRLSSTGGQQCYITGAHQYHTACDTFT